MATSKNTPNVPEEIDFDSFNWDEVEAEVTEVRDQGSKARKIVDVPAKIVADAQKSRDSKKVIRVTFGSDKIAEHYATLMRAAGPHVTPPAGMYVKVDGKNVEYSAGDPRGRKPTNGDDARNGGNE